MGNSVGEGVRHIMLKSAILEKNNTSIHVPKKTLNDTGPIPPPHSEALTSVGPRVWRPQADASPGVSGPAPLSLHPHLPAPVPVLPLAEQLRLQLRLLRLPAPGHGLHLPGPQHRCVQTGPQEPPAAWGRG